MELSHCSWLFVTGTVLIGFGLAVISTSLGVLAFTSSYVTAFPFGAPLWSGGLFVILGCFMLVAYRPSRIQLPASSRSQIWFTLAVSMFAILECLLAVSLCLWYRFTIFPSFRDCTPDLTSPSTVTCECTSDFIDPPSLRTTVHRFMDVSDCSSLGGLLGLFHWVMLGLYSVGVFLASLSGFLAARRLHSFGVFGKSGVYAVTPKPNTPTPNLAANQQLSPSHLVPMSATLPTHTLPGFILNQKYPNDSSPVVSTPNSHSPSTLRSQAPRSHSPSTLQSQAPRSHSPSTLRSQVPRSRSPSTLRSQVPHSRSPSTLRSQAPHHSPVVLRTRSRQPMRLRQVSTGSTITAI